MSMPTRRSSTRCWPRVCTYRRRRTRHGSSAPPMTMPPWPRSPMRCRTPPRPPLGGGEMTADVITRVHLLRHGEVHNPDGVLYGRLPGYHLSDLGQKMADRVADVVSGRDIVQ